MAAIGPATVLIDGNLLVVTGDETTYALDGNPHQVALADRNRVALLVGGFPGVVANVSTQPGVDATKGIALSGVGGTLYLTAREHGPLAKLPWYISGPAGGKVTVITLSGAPQ